MRSWVRTVTVNRVKYLQVVETIVLENEKEKLLVLRSFGKDSPESRLTAILFCAARDTLRKTVKEIPPEELENMRIYALAVFGHILGGKEVERIMGVEKTSA